MRIGLDARYIDNHFPGIGRYTVSLTRALAELDHGHTLVLLHNPPRPNARYRLDDLAALPGVAWENAAEALEAAPPAGAGRITVAARKLGGRIEFSVADNGHGIPDDNRSKVWDLFFTTKEIGTGTGQGLAICYNIVVVKHGGTIDFEGAAGGGARFFFTLALEHGGKAA